MTYQVCVCVCVCMVYVMSCFFFILFSGDLSFAPDFFTTDCILSRQCLADWFRTAQTCPLCRCDLNRAQDRELEAAFFGKF